MALGVLVALPSYGVIVWRTRTRVDETLDVLAAHGIGGLVGILFIGLVAQESWNGVADGLLYGNPGQLWDQAVAALAAPLYAFVATYVLLRLIGAVMPLRATEHEEAIGVDVVFHGEGCLRERRGCDPDDDRRPRAGHGRPVLEAPVRTAVSTPEPGDTAAPRVTACSSRPGSGRRTPRHRPTGRQRSSPHPATPRDPP